jgi:endonuclease-8
VTRVGEVPDLPRMVRRAKQVLEVNKERVQQATTGDLRRGRNLWVYLREDQPCRRCGTTIRGAELGGRATYWCPACQPEPGPSRPGGSTA